MNKSQTQYNIFINAGMNPSLQQYKYNGKEFDRMHGLDWYDYGARNYDPVILIWDRMDQLCEDYYHVSPYVYCMDNPVNATDPDGRKIVITGSLEQRMAVLTELQKLTNDKLGVRRYDGAVIIMAHGTKNTDMKLTKGTELLSDLVNHERTMIIREDKKYRNRVHSNRDVEVGYDFNADIPTVVRDRNTGESIKEEIPKHIALGHELIHGHRAMNGVAKDQNDMTRYRYIDTDGYIYEVVERKEELETTGLKWNYKFTENALRLEQDLSIRIKY